MTQKIFLQKSPSEQSNEKDKSSLKTLLKDVKKADLAKNLMLDVTSGKGMSKEKMALSAIKLIKSAAQENLSEKSTPLGVFEYLKSKYNLQDKPSVEYISSKEKLPGNTKHIVQAVLTVLETDLATQDYFVFEKVGEAFNGRVPRFDHLMPLSVGECAWTVHCMDKMRYQDLSTEVCLYIATCAHEYGFLIMPKALAFCQPYLEKISGVTDLKYLTDLYASNATKTGNDMMDRQLEKVAAVDAYLKQEESK